MFKLQGSIVKVKTVFFYFKCVWNAFDPLKMPILFVCVFFFLNFWVVHRLYCRQLLDLDTTRQVMQSL